jgi:hypothetical protein
MPLSRTYSSALLVGSNSSHSLCWTRWDCVACRRWREDAALGSWGGEWYRIQSKRNLAFLDHTNSILPVKYLYGNWSPIEDNMIIALRSGGAPWKEVSERNPGCSSNACHLRYRNRLKKEPGKFARPMYKRYNPNLDS